MGSSSREEARRKLLERINELRKKRKAVELDSQFKPRTDIEAPPSKRRKTDDTTQEDATKKTNKQLKQENIEKNKLKQEKEKQKQIEMQKDAQASASDDGSGGDDDDEEEPSPADIQFGTFDWSSGKPVPTYLAQKRKRPSNQVLLKKVRLSSFLNSLR